jgi:hypothetical protein
MQSSSKHNIPTLNQACNTLIPLIISQRPFYAYSQYLSAETGLTACGRPIRLSVGGGALPSNDLIRTNIRTNHLLSVRTPAICTDMKTARWEVRCTEEELALWKQEAAKLGMLVSEWMRVGLNDLVDHAKWVRDNPVPDVPRAKSVRAPRGRKPAAVASVDRVDELPAGPTPGICATCEHPRKKHGGWNGCCQEDNCLCVGFE